MNILFNFRVSLFFTLHENVDVNKLIKSIKKLSESNDNIFIIIESNTSDVHDNRIYFTLQNNILKINCSHIFYDGYSIWLICQKIQAVYNNEIKNYTFKIYDKAEYSTLNLVTNTINLLPKINIKKLYNSLIKSKFIKTKIKILKTNLNEISTKEIIHYLVGKLQLEEYCLLVNARKQYKEYENVLGNLIYFSENLNKKIDIRRHLRTHLQKSINKKSIEQKINNTVPNGLLINSYLNFTIPSFARDITVINPICSNYILIHPVNINEKYILVDYYT
jgi:hypothetical protein